MPINWKSALGIAAAAVLGGCLSRANAEGSAMPNKVYPVQHSETEWKKLLTPTQYDVLREHGTEAAFSGTLWDFHGKAEFVCAACGAPLFRSDTKFDSGTGWPSFFAPIEPGRVESITDTSYGMVRTEVRCARCGSHLGHVFDDGPKPTGLRYCINSTALKVAPETK